MAFVSDLLVPARLFNAKLSQSLLSLSRDTGDLCLRCFFSYKFRKSLSFAFSLKMK